LILIIAMIGMGMGIGIVIAITTSGATTAMGGIAITHGIITIAIAIANITGGAGDLSAEAHPVKAQRGASQAGAARRV
jgi:hypothetical protein